MKYLFAFLLVIVCSKKDLNAQTVKQNTWSKTNRLVHLKNQNDSTTWDMELFNGDKQIIGIGDFGPFELGAYPVPDYDLIDQESFKGLGNKSKVFEMKEKELIMNSFFIGKNSLNQHRLNEMEDEVFFQIIVLTDTISPENQSVVLSRNHPDYLGQGFVKTIQNRIDYVAFQTPENNSYAIINTRIFDLNYGKTIIVAPQKDKTLRFLQIDHLRIIPADSIIPFTHELLKDRDIIDFLERKGTI